MTNVTRDEGRENDEFLRLLREMRIEAFKNGYAAGFKMVRYVNREAVMMALIRFLQAQVDKKTAGFVNMVLGIE